MRSINSTLAMMQAGLSLRGLGAIVRYEETGEERPLYTGNTTSRDPEPKPDPETRQQRRQRERKERKARK
jgi:hypothetical protein